MIDLPAAPAPQKFKPNLIDFGSWVEAMLGGTPIRINRLGNRYRVTVVMPPMVHADQGREWLADLLRGKSEGVRMRYPLSGLVTGPAGSPVVDGSGQLGTSLQVRGVTPNFVFRKGYPLSIKTGGIHRLNFIAAASSASSSGIATLSLVTLQRVTPDDGDSIHYERPYVEGRLLGEEFEWEINLAHHTGLSFAIEELS